MPRVERSASVTWEGNLARGSGAITSATGAFSGLPFSLPTRIGDAGGKTSPEELLAAAHAGCFAMSLAGELTGAGTPPARLEVTARVRLDEIEGEGHQIVASTVNAVAEVPGASDDAFGESARAADGGCTFSALLRRAGAEVSIDARLEGGS